jgi:hypothetical protein
VEEDSRLEKSHAIESRKNNDDYVFRSSSFYLQNGSFSITLYSMRGSAKNDEQLLVGQ